METRPLGDSGIEVSAISLGAWMTVAGGIADARAEACVRAAFDVGITFFDTANSYGHGAAEERWGQILAGYRRDSFVLGTKVFMPMGDGHKGGLSRSEIHTQLDASLRRLQTDYIDLYQCHRYDPDTPIEETLEALNEVVDSGKVRAVGFSEWLPDQIRAALAVPSQAQFVSSQVQYNLLWRARGDETFELCDANGISQILWSPLAQGVLAGKYRSSAPPPADSRAASESMSAPLRGDEFPFLEDDVLDAVARLRPVAQQAGLTMSQLALAWVLRRPEVASAIIGASRPDQVYDNAAASGVTLSADVLAAVEAALGDVPVTDYRLVYGQREGVLTRG